MGTNTAKPYKIQDGGRSRRIGVTADNLKELRKKAELRLNISQDFRVCLEDGTEVTTDEYFQSLPPQTCFTFVDPEEKDFEADLLQIEKLTQKLFRRLTETQDIAKEKVREFLTGPNSDIVNRVLLDYVTSLETKIEMESRRDDEAWFVGLSTRFQTKEAAMRASAQSRIRNYYQKAKEYVVEQNASASTVSLVATIHQALHSNEFHGDYFVRSAAQTARICDHLGWFKCEGTFDKPDCPNGHSINPYGSREARIIFSTWNLDHVIEKSREVIPTFVRVAENCPRGQQVNWQYFYDLLFTKKNLKLVHIACHEKRAHIGHICDKREYYKPKLLGQNKITKRSSKRKRVR